MDADVAAAAADVALERRLLGGVQHVAGGVEEHHRLVLGEVAGGEGGGVLGGGDGEAVGRAQVTDGLGADRDRVVPEAGRLGEDEHVIGGVGGLRRGRRQGGGGQGYRPGRDQGFPHRETVHFWLAAAVQVCWDTTVLSAVLLPVTSRHLADPTLRIVPSDCTVQFWALVPLHV